VTPVTYSIFDDWGRGKFWKRRQRSAEKKRGHPANHSPAAT
jgi:hypothetical protein